MIKLKIDRNIYSDACVAKTVYSLSNRYAIQRTLEGNHELLCINTVDGSDEKIVEKVFFSTLNDYKLRQVVEEETHDIRIILYAKAFSEFDDIDIEDV